MSLSARRIWQLFWQTQEGAALRSESEEDELPSEALAIAENSLRVRLEFA